MKIVLMLAITLGFINFALAKEYIAHCPPMIHGHLVTGAEADRYTMPGAKTRTVNVYCEIANSIFKEERLTPQLAIPAEVPISAKIINLHGYDWHPVSKTGGVEKLQCPEKHLADCNVKFCSGFSC